jgi:hypothetical protein
MILDSVEPFNSILESYSTRCYSLRAFERFLNYFGLIKIDVQERGFDSAIYITKTDLYDKLIKCTLHNPIKSKFAQNGNT